jgi:protein tyrosine phosphatase (PTP) superfamily phosphohydrolase (DUF442 family)
MRPTVIAALAAPGLLVLACQGGPSPDAPEPRASVNVAPPLHADDAYAAATTVALPQTPPQEWPGLHNVYKLSDRIWSGSEPHGEAALRQLAALGIKTIISVDGKTPDHEVAARLGLRYVHVPIKYSGVSETEMLRIAKTFRELDGPFYTHCFHGKHRGPVAAAIGRLVLDGVGRDQALAEMRQWCGTGKSYPGLYRTVANGDVPDGAKSASYAWDFPSAKPLGGFRESMIAAPRAFDNLADLAKRDFAPDPEHPDIDARNESEKLAEVFAQAAKLPEVQGKPEDFRAWMDQSAAKSVELREALRAMASGDADAAARAKALVKAVDGLCTACHKAYRNE